MESKFTTREEEGGKTHRLWPEREEKRKKNKGETKVMRNYANALRARDPKKVHVKKEKNRGEKTLPF